VGHKNYRSLSYYKSRDRVVLGARSSFERTQLKILRLWKVSVLLANKLEGLQALTITLFSVVLITV